MSTRDFVELLVLLTISVAAVRYYRDRWYSQEALYSTFWPRFFAACIDASILWPVGLVFTVLFSFIPNTKLLLALSFLPGLIGTTYMVVMHASRGQTYGKAWCRVCVVDARTEGPISLRQALLRESLPAIIMFTSLAYLAYSIISVDRNDEETVSFQASISRIIGAIIISTSAETLWWVIEVITMLLSKKRRALHDIIAGTVVVRTNV